MARTSVHFRWAASFLGTAVALAAAQPPADPQQPAATPPTTPSPTKGVARVLIDRRLQQHAVTLLAFDGDTITYSDPQGLLRKESKEEFLAILPPDQDATAIALRPASEIDLTDGQRFPGTLGAVRATPGQASETVAWEYSVFGPVELKVDQVRRLQLRIDPAAKPHPTLAPGDSDVALLTNGDKAIGLVEGFLAQGPALRLSVSGQSRDIPLDRVQEIQFLSNPIARPPADATILWLRDGAIAACRAFRTARTGEVSFEIAGNATLPDGKAATSTLAASGTIALTDILAADLHPGVLVPLASLAPAEQSPAPGRRWARTVAVLGEGALLHISDVELPGPMTAEWELPAGVNRFAAEAELPRASWDWGDEQISVTLISAGHETEVFRRRLTADQPRATINAALGSTGAPPAPGSRLRIRLDPSASGAIQDRVVLHRPVLLVDRPS